MVKKNNTKNREDAFSLVQQFYQFMNSNKLEVIEYSKDNTYVKLVRKHSNTSYPIPVFSTQNYPAQQNNSQPKNTAASAATPVNEGETIKAPVSGIFYRAPSPSSPPYVRDGDSVKEGQVICVIEAMKVFNELKAEFDCEIKKVAVENGTPVATNDDLFFVKRL